MHAHHMMNSEKDSIKEKTKLNKNIIKDTLAAEKTFIIINLP